MRSKDIFYRGAEGKPEDLPTNLHLSHQRLLTDRPKVAGFYTETNIVPLTAWSSALLEKPQVLQLFKKFPTFYGTALTSALHWSLS
jgi:hypothetical protein